MANARDIANRLREHADALKKFNALRAQSIREIASEIEFGQPAGLVPKFAVGDAVQLGPEGVSLEVMSIGIAYSLGSGGQEMIASAPETVLEPCVKGGTDG